MCGEKNLVNTTSYPFCCYLENNLSVDTQVQQFFYFWPFSCSPKKKAEKEGRRSDAAGAAFPRIAPVVEAGASALRTFGAFLDDGAGGNRAEKPLPPAPDALENLGARLQESLDLTWSPI